MKFQPALVRLSHWSELIKPVGYLLLLTLGLAFFPIPFWAALLVGVMVGGGTYLRERFRFVQDTPQCIEVTATGITVTAKLSIPQSVAWSAVREVAFDDELCGWRIESADKVFRFGVSGLSRAGMLAIAAAFRENSTRHHFSFKDDADGIAPPEGAQGGDVQAKEHLHGEGSTHRSVLW